MKEYLIFGDSHLESERVVDNSYLLFKQVVEKRKPDNIVCLGDALDFGYISRFSDIGSQEGKRLSKDIELFKEEFKFFKKYSKGEVTFLSGNHEDRLLKLLNAQPVLQGLVSIESVCEELGIKYIPTDKQPYKLFDDLYITHGLTFAKYAAGKLADTAGASIISGHTHRTQSYVNSYPDGRLIQSYCLGSLTNITEYYERGKRITGHSNSFGQLLIDETGYWQFNTIMISNDKCVVDKKEYSLINTSSMVS